MLRRTSKRKAAPPPLPHPAVEGLEHAVLGRAAEPVALGVGEWAENPEAVDGPAVPDAAVWVDEADEQSTVDLLAHGRRKKLREQVDDTQVSGAEYSARLRRQFRRVHAAPSWAETPCVRMAEGAAPPPL